MLRLSEELNQYLTEQGRRIGISGQDFFRLLVESDCNEHRPPARGWDVAGSRRVGRCFRLTARQRSHLEQRAAHQRTSMNQIATEIVLEHKDRNDGGRG